MHIQNKNEALELIYFQSAQDLPAYWNEDLPENHFLQKEQLAIIEAAHLPNLSFYYVMVMKNNQMHSKHYFQLLRLNKQHLYNKEDGTLKKRVSAGNQSPSYLPAAFSKLSHRNGSNSI